MTTFMVIGLVGLVLLLVSLVVGDLFDGVFDALAGDVFSSAVIGGFVVRVRLRRRAREALGAPTLVSVAGRLGRRRRRSAGSPGG